MKIFFLLISALSIFFIGCSSIYTVKNFTSKEKMYWDINKTTGDKTIKVTLINDSSFTFENGAHIENDSLFFFAGYNTEKIKINPAEIKNVKYFGDNYTNLSAIIYLNNGKELKADSVSLFKDTINVEVTNAVNGCIPVNKIKKISYKNIVLGVIPGFLIGTATGGMAAISIFSLQNNNPDDAVGSFVVVPVCSIAGIIWGCIAGYNYVYEFNP
jgi:hypothetical protein